MRKGFGVWQEVGRESSKMVVGWPQHWWEVELEGDGTLTPGGRFPLQKKKKQVGFGLGPFALPFMNV